MNKYRLEDLSVNNGYIVLQNPKYDIVFSTAEGYRNFNRHTEDGLKTLDNLKDEFNVSEVVYLRQVHSDKVVKYYGQGEKEVIEEEADAIISDIRNTIFGVFTADCVPILLIDEEKKVGAAIHSGWKGTYNSITKKTIEALIEEYDVNVDNISAYIGPHIRQCCYEVSEDLKEKFIKKKNRSENELFIGRNLNLEECILQDLRGIGVKEEKINSLCLCTHCCKEIKLHSYRKSNGDYGRLFSFVILK